MALKINISKNLNYYPDDGEIAEIAGKDTTKSEVAVFPLAYVMVSSMAYDKTRGRIDFTATIFDTEAKIHTIDTERGSFSPSLSQESANFVVQTYNYLKGLPTFVGAIDC